MFPGQNQLTLSVAPPPAKKQVTGEYVLGRMLVEGCAQQDFHTRAWGTGNILLTKVGRERIHFFTSTLDPYVS